MDEVKCEACDDGLPIKEVIFRGSNLRRHIIPFDSFKKYPGGGLLNVDDNSYVAACPCQKEIVTNGVVMKAIVLVYHEDGVDQGQEADIIQDVYLVPNDFVYNDTVKSELIKEWRSSQVYSRKNKNKLIGPSFRDFLAVKFQRIEFVELNY